MKLKGLFSRVLLVAALAVLAAACQQSVDVELDVAPKHYEIEGKRGTQFVTVTAPAGSEWTITLTDSNGSPVDWVDVDPPTGIGTRTSVTITWNTNATGENRTVVITCVCGAQKAIAQVTQQPYSSGSASFPDMIHSDPVPKWMELPATKDASLYFISHTSTNRAGRNFSYYWDVDALVAHWVAYPLNKNLISTGGRSEKWGLDPKLPKDKQPWLFSGYRSGTATRYDRGHQLPSADRLAYQENVQTFYGTNMTPQMSDFNGKIWASLEAGVREWSRQFDTLYVVTGCVVKGSTECAYDNAGKQVAVPTGYYKVLLGYDKTRVKGAQTQGYSGVAFYLDHMEYPNNDYMKTAMTIDALEAKLGEDFFVNLPGAIGEVLASQVESTKDNFWWGK